LQLQVFFKKIILPRALVLQETFSNISKVIAVGFLFVHVRVKWWWRADLGVDGHTSRLLRPGPCRHPSQPQLQPFQRLRSGVKAAYAWVAWVLDQWWQRSPALGVALAQR
jgi:hypothetical protein